MTARYLHFTLGPVQGFISDARRTRDLWAGSFLLSWLSGQAMAALVKEGGRIIFPDVQGDDLFEAISEYRRDRKTDRTPYIGSLPNRFKADVSAIADKTGDTCTAAIICENAIQEAWEGLTKAVWDQFVGPVAQLGNGTKAIWNRQVEAFWETAWVAGEEELDGDGRPVDGAWLDQRKNWRNHFPMFNDEPSVEEGDLCRLMGRYQEVSGHPRIGGKDKQDAFYNALRACEYQHPGGRRGLNELNIGKTERLCALALVKRLFPLLDKIETVIGWRPGGKGDNGVNVVNWPSVSYIAAVPWLKGAGALLGAEQSATYFKAAETNLARSYRGETETRLFGFPKDERFFTLDGHLLHEDGIRAWEEEGFKGHGDEALPIADRREENRRSLLSAHKALCRAISETLEKKETVNIKTSPSEFYAILLMDGDRVGAKIRDHEPVIKDGLARFTKRVKTYFNPHAEEKNPANGALIYAGGDDVLAFTPIDTAIEAARHLHEAYRRSFEEAVAKADEAKSNPNNARPEEFTLSGAIVFAQYKIPLRAVLDTAHHHLDKIAKDRNGRDSLAIAVMKPGGIAFDWVSCWTADPIETMEKVARDRSDYSSSFFYNLRERYAPLFDEDDDSEDSAESTLEGHNFMEAILTAEYKKQPGKGQLPIEETRSRIAPLLAIGHPLERTSGTERPRTRYHFEGALVARFMAEEGRWGLMSASPQGESTDG